MPATQTVLPSLDARTPSPAPLRQGAGRGPALAGLAGLAALSACSTMPQPPPISARHGEGLFLGDTVGTLVAPAKVTATSPQTGVVTIRETTAGVPVLTGMTDPRLSLVDAPADVFNWSAHLSWSSFGGEARVLPLGSHGRLPVMLAIGGQADGLVASTAGHAFEGRGTASLHPVLSRAWSALLGVGYSVGKRRRHVDLPADAPGAIGKNAADNQTGPAFDILRPENRVEGALGIVFSPPRVRIVLAVQGYYVASSGPTTAECSFCVQDAMLLKYENAWGVVPTFSVFVAP